jgi:hypothetical protein
MRRSKKVIYFAVIIITFLFNVNYIYAFEIKDHKIDFKAGTKGYYSEGMSDAYFYYKPYSEITYLADMFEISCGYYRYQNYQITNGKGKYKYIDFNQTGANFKLIPFESFNFSGGFLYAFGDKKYSSMDFIAEASFELNPFTFNFNFDYQTTEYKSGRDSKATTNSYTISPEVEYDFDDYFSLDASYQYIGSNYKVSSDNIKDVVDNKYIQQLIRIGSTYKITKKIFITDGISAGFDNSDYIFYGFDFGGSIKIVKSLKINANYSFLYYNYNKSKNSDSADKNQKQKLSNVGKSFSANSVNLGISYTF